MNIFQPLRTVLECKVTSVNILMTLRIVPQTWPSHGKKALCSYCIFTKVAWGRSASILIVFETEL